MGLPQALRDNLHATKRTWLVTGAAGFIGSNLVESLLTHDQQVVGIDNFLTGSQTNIDEVVRNVGSHAAKNFRFFEGDITRPQDCADALLGVNIVLHQAALGSVPRSLEDPLRTHHHNVTGTLTLLHEAAKAKVERVVYASSSSVYGDHPVLPKQEANVGAPLSPYAASKAMAEMYAKVTGRCYGLSTIGLRYFNVFGARQSPEGPYAAVIPVWIASLMKGDPVYINGDGETSRDFCYIDNVVQANLLAGLTKNPEALQQVFNIAVHARTTLNALFAMLRDQLALRFPHVQQSQPHYRDFRPGDVQHSFADIEKAKTLLGYQPTVKIAEGLAAALPWYIDYALAQQTAAA